MTNDQSLQLADALLKFQHKRRILSQTLGAEEGKASPNLSFIEETILRSVNETDRYNVTELAAAVNLERSWISRVVVNLETSGLIICTPDKNDRRNKTIAITSAGLKALNDTDEFADKIIKLALTNLEESEIDKLAKSLHQLTDAIDAPGRGTKLHGDNIHYNLNRLSRLLGIFGESVFGLELTLIELYIFWILNESGESTLMQLDTRIPFDSSSISRTVSAPEKKNLVRKAKSATDARVSNLSLTPSGKEKYLEITRRIRNISSPGIAKIGEKTTDILIKLISKALGNSNDYQRSSIKVITANETDESLSQRIGELTLPAEKSDAVNLGLFEGAVLKAFIEISRSAESKNIQKIQISGNCLTAADIKLIADALNKNL